MFNINFANDWIRTADLCYRKRPLYLPTEPQPLPKKITHFYFGFKMNSSATISLYFGMRQAIITLIKF